MKGVVFSHMTHLNRMRERFTDVHTLLPDMTAHQLYQQKYQRYQHLIAALQGFHARIKEHIL